MWTQIKILLVCACVVTAQIIEKDGIDTKDQKAGNWLLDIINKILENIKPHLKSLIIDHFDFKTGDQEFGNFNGFIDKVNITGLSDLVATKIEASIIPLKVKNLTIEFENVNLKGDYNLDGGLFFPINNDLIHVFGNGPMNITLNKVVVSVAANLKYSMSTCTISISDLTVFLDIGGLQVELKDIMGGGDLEKAFNTLFTDIGLTVIYYYKDKIIEGLIPFAIPMINKFLENYPNPNDHCSQMLY